MSYDEFRNIAGADNRIGLDEFVSYEQSKYPYKDPYEVRKLVEQKFYIMDIDGNGRIDYNEFYNALMRVYESHQHLFYDSPAQIYQAHPY